jgi:hypothetical protein
MYEITSSSFDEQRRQRNMLASRALLLRLRRLHYEHAPPDYKSRFLPAPIVGDPLLEIGRVSVERQKEAAAAAARAKKLDPAEEIEVILTAVARYYQVDVEHILSDRRTHKLVRPRQVVMYLCDKLTNLSYPTIAVVMNRDHTVVIHGARMIEKRMETDATLAVQVQILEMQLSELKRVHDAKCREKRRDYYRTPWPEERVKRLVELRNQGISYRKISQAMGGISARLCQAKYREVTGAA